MIAILLAALWVGPAQSGSWYGPERNGEGFTLQVLENGTAHAIWFTYPPAGSASQQAWIYAQDGRVNGDVIRFENAVTTRGPRFGPGFDPSALQMIPWGTIEFRFTACNTASMTYSGPAAWGSGTRTLTRLTALSELECTGKRHLGARGERTLAGLRARSGSWFDPAHNGEGWQVEELPDGRSQVYWFTYDERGEQAWTIGVSPTSGTRMVIEDNYRPVGTSFGPTFNPAQVRLERWGRLELDLNTCLAGAVRYQSIQSAFGSGTLAPTRLTVPSGAVCLDGTPAVPANATWSMAAPMPTAASESAAMRIGNLAYVVGGYGDPAGFRRYDLDRNAWTTLAPLPGGRDHVLGVAVNGDIFATGGNHNGSAVHHSPGFRYNMAQNRWDADDRLPGYVAAGSASLGGHAWFANIVGGLMQYNPRTGNTREIAGDNAAPRDHSQLVAFQGELWMIGGRSGTRTTGIVSIWDPASETWRAGPTLNTARAGFAAAASDTLIMVAGGEVLTTDPWRTLNSVEAIAAGATSGAGATTWTVMPSLPNSVHGVPGVIYGNAFYTLGGSTQAGVAANYEGVQVLRW